MLESYRKKRDFRRTPEPRGERGRKRRDLHFVVQKHKARRLHYDLRLELDGVLVSWAVPKGPSLDPGDKRLAVRTEDHPLEYQHFEGSIPAGEYGAGQVNIWDAGTYTAEHSGKAFLAEPDKGCEYLRKGLKDGHLSFTLYGERLKGQWTLVRLSDEKNWILFKNQDAETKHPISRTTARDLPPLKDLPGIKTAKFPSAVVPMNCSLADEPFNASGWIYEPKLDGIRVIALIKNGKATLLSRNGLNLTKQYPSIAEELSLLNKTLVLDGEVVVLNEHGLPSFQALQQRSGLTSKHEIADADRTVPAYFYAFDILYIDKFSLEKVPLYYRKGVLNHLVISGSWTSGLTELRSDGIRAYQVCVKKGLEGIVAKNLNSVYEQGKRSKSWLKIKKTHTADLIICGYTTGTGARASTFGALVLGYYDEKMRLVYAGNCGTGFDDTKLKQLLKQFDSLKTTKPTLPLKLSGKIIHWLEPHLVAEIKFVEWTRDNILRAPVFLHLRTDKNPEDCTLAPLDT